MTARLIAGDCRAVMATLPEASVDAIVTDPPYGIRFMGKAWDRFDIDRMTAAIDADDPNMTANAEAYPGGVRTKSAFANRASKAGAYDFSATANQAFQAWCREWATAALRVLKPGGHLLVFGGTRTYHRMASGIEDAGFEIRDALCWLYGSGFPKSLDVSKALDKAAGNLDIQSQGANYSGGEFAPRDKSFRSDYGYVYAPSSDLARQWDGWGTALKPAYEPIVMARKPLAGTVAGNVATHGAGALNVDGCRIVANERPARERTGDLAPVIYGGGRHGSRANGSTDQGRWPANVLLDEAAAALLDEQSGERPAGNHPRVRNTPGYATSLPQGETGHDGARLDGGGASRFFYTAKASRAEREKGLLGAPRRLAGMRSDHSGQHITRRDGGDPGPVGNHHPTVKPLAVMQWLARLVTPPGGVLLDPFLGSGTCGVAADREGFSFIGIELDASYMAVALARMRGDCPMFADVAIEGVAP